MTNIIEDSQVISYDKYEWIENDSVAMFEGFFHNMYDFMIISYLIHKYALAWNTEVNNRTF